MSILARVFEHFRSFLMLTLLAAAGNSAAQSPASSQIISLRAGLNQVKDKNLHPLVSSGSIVELGYGFEKQKQGLHEFHLGLGLSRPKTDLEDVAKSVNLKFNLAYSRSYFLWQTKKYRLYLGPEVTAAYTASFFPNWDDSHLYWANHFSLGPRAVLARPMSGNKEWRTTLSLPVFSLYSRPDLYRLYKIDEVNFSGIMSNLHSNLSPGSWNRCFFLRLGTELRFPAFTNKAAAFEYRFELLRMKNPDSKAYAQISHLIGLNFYL